MHQRRCTTQLGCLHLARPNAAQAPLGASDRGCVPQASLNRPQNSPPPQPDSSSPPDRHRTASACAVGSAAPGARELASAMPMLHPRSRGCAEEATFEHAVSKPAGDRDRGSCAREEGVVGAWARDGGKYDYIMSCGATENIATTIKISHRPRFSNPSYVTVYGTCITQPNSAVVVPS